MQKSETQLDEIKLIGKTLRTRLQDECNPEKAKIGRCVQSYFLQGEPDKIPNRKYPGTTYCAYTEYESDYTGEYTYFIGEEVTSLDELPEGFNAITIPAQTYAKFTPGPDSMPKVVIEAWQKIWDTTETNLGGKRQWITDFEVYDERAKDPSKVVLDIYVGIQK